MTSMNSMRLRELIRSVRMCKTSSEERELINRESAWIRKEFKEGTPYLRTRNMLKLLYLRLLGYPTEFGQLEVINLLSQSDFSGKRIGYLALQLIMDENDEVLTLSENRMMSDMVSGDPLLQAVALNAASNVASADMARDIFEEVIHLVDSNNIYIRRKACLAALRIVRKAPEYAEYFLERFVDIFSNNRVAHLLCSLALINECLQTEAGAAFLPRYRELAPEAVSALKRLVLSMRISERDIGDVADPFLQVKILEFMRITGKGSTETSELYNDILAQVITNTNSSRTVGCAVEYECIRTIDAIESEKDLRALAVNTIMNFLSSTNDNNLCFVALEVLLNYAKTDPKTVLNHQSTILECLKDADVSIRRRALELTVLLITEDNVRLLVPDLLSYLSFCTEEMREDVTLRISQIIEEKYPSDEWRIEMSIKLLKLAKQHATISFASHLIGLISNQPSDVQARVVRALWDEESMTFDATHQSRRAFLIVALWTIGEHAEYLLQSNQALKTEEITKSLSVITANSTDRQVKLYGVTALMKMAARYPEVKTSVLGIFSTLMGSLDCELQQRACEYTTLLTEFPEEAAFSFGHMPPIHLHNRVELSRVAEVAVSSPELNSNQIKADLDDLFGFSEQKKDLLSSADAHNSAVGGLPETGAQLGVGLFLEGAAGVQGNLNSAQVAPFLPSSVNTAPVNYSNASIDADFAAKPFSQPSSTTFLSQQPIASYSPPKEVKLFSCPNFVATLSNTSMYGHTVAIELLIQSRLEIRMENLSLLVAVPKTHNVRLAPLTSTFIEPHGQLLQKAEIDVGSEANNFIDGILRVKLSYSVNGEPKEDQFQI